MSLTSTMQLRILEVKRDMIMKINRIVLIGNCFHVTHELKQDIMIFFIL